MANYEITFKNDLGYTTPFTPITIECIGPCGTSNPPLPQTLSEQSNPLTVTFTDAPGIIPLKITPQDGGTGDPRKIVFSNEVNCDACSITGGSYWGVMVVYIPIGYENGTTNVTVTDRQ